MGFLDKVKGAFNKDEQPAPKEMRITAPQDPVVDWIIQKRNAGTDDDEIKKLLLAHKHTPEAIEEAMRKANAATGMEPMPPIEFPEPKTMTVAPKLDEAVETYSQSQALAEIENIIEDRVKKVQADIDTLEKWKHQVESDLEALKSSMDQVMQLVKDTRDKEREKFDEYDRHLSEVKVELKATQEVFRKGLPEFTKGIQELSRMVKKGAQ